jgi:hypothetical protein
MKGAKGDPTPTAEQKRWEAEDDMRTLVRAEQIKADRGRMSRVKSVAREQARTAAKIAGRGGKK